MSLDGTVRFTRNYDRVELKMFDVSRQIQMDPKLINPLVTYNSIIILYKEWAQVTDTLLYAVPFPKTSLVNPSLAILTVYCG